MNILVTGAAGFIGAAVCKTLLERGDRVVGVDNLNDYYDVGLKQARLRWIEQSAGAASAAISLSQADSGGRSGFSRDGFESAENEIAAEAAPASISSNFTFSKLDLIEDAAVENLFRQNRFDRVIHLAAQPGVRYSLENPRAYIDSNVVGFLNVLEACRRNDIEHLVYASSSSIYGANESMPFAVGDNVDHPVSLYAATKKSNELMAHTWSHLYGLPTTGLRFFTVYGPWGRPDMAPILFTKAILAGEPIKVFNYGKHRRDFTYIDDIVEGVIRAVDKIAEPDPDWSGQHPDPATSRAPYRLYNIGSNHPIELGYFIQTLENALGKKAEKELLPLQPGDVEATYANVDSLIQDMGYQPRTTLEEGIQNFVTWYKTYYNA